MCNIGDLARVRTDQIIRCGQTGVVIDVFDQGVCIDFDCDAFGDRHGWPTQEMWLFEEIEIMPVGRMN